MSGGGILKALAPMAVMAIPGVGEALSPALMSAGLGSSAAGAVSSGLIGGALTGGISALTGGKNPLRDALLGGAASGIGNYALGGKSPLDSLNGGAGNDVINIPGNPAAGMQAVNAGGGLPDTSMWNPANFPSANFSPEAASAAPSFLSKAGDYIADHPLQSVLLGTTGLAALDSVMPQKKVKAADNGYNDALPEYHMETSSTPYTGDWYTYGMSPQGPQISNQVKRGPAQPYAKGGAVNPLRPQGQVPERGNGGHEDNVPAMLSEGEFVIPAEVVSALGDGSSKAGGKKLDSMIKNVRKHKTSKGAGFAPKAKNPLAYVGA